MSLQLLFTGFSVLLLGYCVYFAWRAGQSAEKAAHSEHRLAIMRGQVAGLEASMEALNAKHNKLAGRVYADEYWRGKDDKQPELEPAADFDPNAQRDAFGIICVNWTTAQRDGPSSPSAGCECEYCNARRADRAARRAKLRAGVKS